jgi:hypothetical protein
MVRTGIIRLTTKKSMKNALSLLSSDQNKKGSKSLYFILDRLEW